MLIHHLFYNSWSRELYNDIIVHDMGVVNQIGIFSKLCVAIFVFVSGYGLTISTPKNIKLKDFYMRRFKKLYLNYWYIWLLFVPVSVFVFGRTFTDAYGDHVAFKFVLDIFGFLKMFGYDSYNPTWWFYNLIIVLYIIFPLLNKWLWRTPYLIVSFAFAIGIFGFIPVLRVISAFLLVFISGMLMARLPLTWIEEMKWWHIVIALTILVICRFPKQSPIHIVDSLLCIGLALLLYKVQLWRWLRLIFESLGKHSMNMFLIHTFIFCYWFKDYIYITKNPILILLSLLVSTYLLSVAIEWTKQKIGFYKL